MKLDDPQVQESIRSLTPAELVEVWRDAHKKWRVLKLWEQALFDEIERRRINPAVHPPAERSVPVGEQLRGWINWADTEHGDGD